MMALAFTSPKELIERRKRDFAAINQFVTARGGQMESIPGDPSMRMSVPVGSPLPARMRELGYEVSFLEHCQRINPCGKVELVAQRADGELEIVVNSTRATQPRTHATIEQVEIFAVAIPPGATIGATPGRYIPGR